MRKSKKLLSLFLLLLFVVPFIPSEYVRGSELVATVTLDRDKYIFGEGPIIATVKLPIEISEEREVDLLYSDENGELGISNHGVPGKSGGRDTFTFKIEPRRSGDFHVVLIAASGGMPDPGIHFKLQPNYEAGQYKLSEEGIHFSADFSAGTPKITDFKYIGEADFENPLVVELSLEDDTNVEAIELTYVSDQAGNRSIQEDVEAIRYEKNKFRTKHPITSLYNGVMHLDKITFKYNTGVNYVIADDNPDYYVDLFNEQTDLENWNKVLPKEFSYAGAGIDIRVDKEEYPHGSPIKFEVSIEESLYDRYKMRENYLFIEKIPKPRSGEGQHVRLNWNEEKGIYEATANEFDSSSSDIFRVGAILFDVYYYGEGEIDAWSYLLVEDDVNIRFEEKDVVIPTVKNIEPLHSVGTEDGVAARWAGIAVDLDNGDYDEVSYIDARLYNLNGETNGQDTLEVRLEKAASGRFAGETKYNRFYMAGTFELHDLTLYNADGEQVYSIYRQEANPDGDAQWQKLAGGDIYLGKEQNVGFDAKKYGLNVESNKSNYGLGEIVKFNVELPLNDGEVFPYKYGFIELYKMNGNDTDTATFVKVMWDKVKREFIAADFKPAEPNDYKGAVIWFGNDPNNNISGNRLTADFGVELHTPIEFKTAQVVDSNIDDLYENGEEFYKEIEKALEELDPSVPEEKKQIEVIEKLLRDIDTKVKAIEPAVKAEAPKFVFNESNLRALKIEEARDPNVKNVQVEVGFSVKTEEEISALLGEKSGVIGLYDLSLLKRVILQDGSATVKTIENEDILGMITLRIPLPAGFPSDKIPTVVYVDNEGKIYPLNSEVKEEDGVKYVYFETDHFSLYGIMAVDSEKEPETPVEDIEIPVVTPVTPETPVIIEKEVEVAPIDEKEEEAKEVKEEKESDTLPKAGVGFVWMYSVSGMVLMTAGVFGLRKKEEKE